MRSYMNTIYNREETHADVSEKADVMNFHAPIRISDLNQNLMLVGWFKINDTWMYVFL